MSKWEFIDTTYPTTTTRLKVATGWIYQMLNERHETTNTVFVPSPIDCKYCDMPHVIVYSNCNDIKPKEMKPLPTTFYDDH